MIKNISKDIFWEWDNFSKLKKYLYKETTMKSLILAQDER